MKRKNIIIIIFIISALLIVSGISYNLLIENKNTKVQDEDKDKDKKYENKKEEAEKIILDRNDTLKKEKLEFVSNNKNIYTYSYKVDDSSAIVNYEVDVEKGTYTLVIGQLTKSE